MFPCTFSKITTALTARNTGIRFAYRYAETRTERVKLVSLMVFSALLWVTGVSGSVKGIVEDWRSLGGSPFDCACEAEQCANSEAQ